MKCDFKFLLKYHKKCTLLFMYLTNGIVAVQIHSLVYYSCSFPYIAFSTVDILIAAANSDGYPPKCLNLMAKIDFSGVSILLPYYTLFSAVRVLHLIFSELTMHPTFGNLALLTRRIMI